MKSHFRVRFSQSSFRKEIWRRLFSCLRFRPRRCSTPVRPSRKRRRFFPRWGIRRGTGSWSRPRRPAGPSPPAGRSPSRWTIATTLSTWTINRRRIHASPRANNWSSSCRISRWTSTPASCRPTRSPFNTLISSPRKSTASINSKSYSLSITFRGKSRCKVN